MRKWTDEEIALLGTDNDSKIAKIIGVHRCSVKNKRIALNIKHIGPKPTAHSEEANKMREELQQAGSATNLAKKRKISRQRISQLLKRLGINVREAYPCSNQT